MAQMNKPNAKNVSFNALLDAIIARQVKLVIFEELHNALLKGDAKFRGAINKFFKNLWNMPPINSVDNWASPDRNRNDHRLVILLTGTHEVLPVLNIDDELDSRCSVEIVCEYTGFFPLERFAAFRKVFRELASRFEVDDLLLAGDKAVVSRCLISTGGHLRRLEGLIERASTLRRRLGKEVSALDLMARAASQFSYSGTRSNAFELDDAELEQYVHREKLKQK